MYPIAVLCGGLGTRLLPRTEVVPKAMIGVLGQPFIDILLRSLVLEAISHVVLCVAHLSEVIEEHVADGSQFGLNVSYSYDGAERLGTAGAIRKAIPMLGDRFGVVYGDSYLRCDFPEVQRAFDESKCDGLMTVLHNRGALVPSNVAVDAGRVTRYDKFASSSTIEYVDYGLTYYTARAFDMIPEVGASDLSDVATDLIRESSLASFEVSDRFYEIGSVEGLADTEAYLKGLRP